MTLRLAVVGAAGRMGRQLVRAIHETDGVALSAATEAEGSSAIGADAGDLAGTGPLGVAVVANAADAYAGADGILDFTTPSVSVALARIAADRALVHVIGTTGFSAEDEAAIAEAARSAVIVKSGNMSLGVNLVAALAARAAAALGDTVDIEIVEMHHRQKVDAPSGTAILLGEAVASGLGTTLAERAIWSREGHTGPRPDGAIGFATLRGGTVVGEHSVVFAGTGERVVLGHISEDRAIFARGAVRAALWAKGRTAGLYSMIDVLGLGSV